MHFIKTFKINNMSKYWHISAKENRESILKNGLKCDNKGYIYLINRLYDELHDFDVKISIPDSIAISQVFLKDYDLFEIDSEGLTSKILRDNVREKLSNYQNRIKQSLINPEHINFISHQRVNIREVLEYDFYKLIILTQSLHLIITKKQTEEIKKTDVDLALLKSSLKEQFEMELETRKEMIEKFLM
jgi:hypothetical protein